MKTTYGVFRGNTVVFDVAHLTEILYDLFEDMELEVQYLRWDKEKQQFDVSFEEIKDEEDWKKTREMCS